VHHLEGRFEGKVAVIAGGGRGIGAECALRLASEGAAVVVGDILADDARATAQAIVDRGGRAVGEALDISDEESVRDVMALAVSTFGGIDLLDNNAAETGPVMAGDTDVVDIDLAVWDRVFAVNLRGFLLTCRHAIPAMRERGGGAIVNIASGSGLTGEPDHVAYGCSKAGVMQLARHIAVRWGKDGIRANSIAPGMIVSNPALYELPAYQQFAELISLRICTPELGTVQDIAGTVAYLLSDDSAYVNGQTLQVDGGMFLRGGSGRASEASAGESLADLGRG
jgi:NAD(P)-dependent dehydrogenase (short-subunit alcohol dehydrogenase family)